MMSLGGPGGPSAADEAEEAKAANMAVVGTSLTFTMVCAFIHVSPYLLEQFGFQVTK
jgi:hypothetical protein